MYPAVSLCAAAVCLGGSVYCYRHRDGVLRLMTRLRGYDSSEHRRPRRQEAGPGPDSGAVGVPLLGARGLPAGSRRRYQRGRSATVDMLTPVLGLLLLALVFVVSGVLALR